MKKQLLLLLIVSLITACGSKDEEVTSPTPPAQEELNTGGNPAPAPAEAPPAAAEQPESTSAIDAVTDVTTLLSFIQEDKFPKATGGNVSIYNFDYSQNDGASFSVSWWIFGFSGNSNYSDFSSYSQRTMSGGDFYEGHEWGMDGQQIRQMMVTKINQRYQINKVETMIYLVTQESDGQFVKYVIDLARPLLANPIYKFNLTDYSGFQISTENYILLNSSNSNDSFN